MEDHQGGKKLKKKAKQSASGASHLKKTKKRAEEDEEEKNLDRGKGWGDSKRTGKEGGVVKGETDQENGMKKRNAEKQNERKKVLGPKTDRGRPRKCLTVQGRTRRRSGRDARA